MAERAQKCGTYRPLDPGTLAPCATCRAAGGPYRAPAGVASCQGPLRCTSGRHVWVRRHQRDRARYTSACRAGRSLA
eukprot:359402-Chlamydomonas_euryale.AAC.4